MCVRGEVGGGGHEISQMGAEAVFQRRRKRDWRIRMSAQVQSDQSSNVCAF